MLLLTDMSVELTFKKEVMAKPCIFLIPMVTLPYMVIYKNLAPK